MNIYEAICEAQKSSGEICRTFGNHGALLILPIPDARHDLMGCRLEYRHLNRPLHHPTWVPSLDDLLADNWEVFTQEARAESQQEK